jgi:demethylmenaquinone methyltransferase/2-methoxy-6-polyprenyl-1,4-benzoquinol methylase
MKQRKIGSMTPHNEQPHAHAAQDDRQLAEFFDRCARQRLMYEFEPVECEMLRQFMERWAIRPGMRVLEPGCGAGRLTAVLAEAVGSEGKVVACDLSPEMIRLVRERQLPRQAVLLNRSVAEISDAAGWFDRVICLNVFPHFLDQAGMLRVFARLLQPAGQLWINHFEGRDSLNHFHHHAAPEVERHQLPCPHTLRGLLEATGFELLELEDRADAYGVKAVKRASPLTTTGDLS